jgi:hypothetical protein
VTVVTPGTARLALAVAVAWLLVTVSNGVALSTPEKAVTTPLHFWRGDSTHL